MATSSTSFDNKMSLYIPRCDTRSLPRKERGQTQPQYETEVKSFISKQFKAQRIGEVERVDLVPKKTPDGYTYFIAFLHFDHWYDSEQARALQNDILTEGTRAKLQFHEKWFWICNKNNKPLAAEEVDMAKKMYMQQQQILQLQAQLAQMQQMGVIPTQMYMQHPMMMPQQMPVHFQYNPAQFPPIPGPSQLTRQTNEPLPEDEE